MASKIFAAALLVISAVLVAATFLPGSDETTSVESGTSTETAVASSESDEDTEMNDQATPATPPLALVDLGPRKDLVNLDGWLNTDATSIDDFDGQLLIVEMWTFGCYNCKNRIPYTQDLYAQYHSEGLEIIGVHAPEFDHEADISNIENAIESLGVTWPVALDTDKTNFRAWQEGGRRFWPRTFVVDQAGNVRFDHIGEGDYAELEEVVDWLIANPA